MINFNQNANIIAHHYQLWWNGNGPVDLFCGAGSCLPLIDWEWDLDFGLLKQFVTNLEYDESCNTQSSYDDWSWVKILDQLEGIDPCLNIMIGECECMRVCVYACMVVGPCLATKLLIEILPSTGGQCNDDRGSWANYKCIQPYISCTCQFTCRFC